MEKFGRTYINGRNHIGITPRMRSDNVFNLKLGEFFFEFHRNWSNLLMFIAEYTFLEIKKKRKRKIIIYLSNNTYFFNKSLVNLENSSKIGLRNTPFI